MASSATLPPYLMGSAAAHLDEDDEEEDDGVDPIGRNTLKMRSREIVGNKGTGLHVGGQPMMPPSAYPTGRGGENSYGSNASSSSYGAAGSYQPQKPPGGGYSGYSPSHLASYHPQHPPSLQYPPTQYPGPRQPPPQQRQQQQGPGGGGQWAISDDMMHQPWGSVLRTLNRT